MVEQSKQGTERHAFIVTRNGVRATDGFRKWRRAEESNLAARRPPPLSRRVPDRSGHALQSLVQKDGVEPPAPTATALQAAPAPYGLLLRGWRKVEESNPYAFKAHSGFRDPFPATPGAPSVVPEEGVEPSLVCLSSGAAPRSRTGTCQFLRLLRLPVAPAPRPVRGQSPTTRRTTLPK
jgi:hypothetical protein